MRPCGSNGLPKLTLGCQRESREGQLALGFTCSHVGVGAIREGKVTDGRRGDQNPGLSVHVAPVRRCRGGGQVDQSAFSGEDRIAMDAQTMWGMRSRSAN